ncbi:MAG: low specificity L-threonine aldolase [Streptosporangiales bacterium]|nr:low specificity L-threonine aldolase [Streptosporangiales bacterium]
MTGLADLRSDTVTRPTPGMRAAMAAAEVGDDGYREDPSVRALEEQVAGLFGHEAALFVPSGHMANLTAVAAQTAPGQVVLLDARSHIARSELEWPVRITRLRPRIEDLPDPGRALTLPGTPRTAVVCVEQTQGHRGGRVIPEASLRELRSAATTTGTSVHCDGARIWNASTASGVPLSTYGSLLDSLAVCFSKGLGAPVGSAVVGSRDLVDRAREWRHLLGGRMRQAGVLAAAASYALTHHRDRLPEDHRNAALLAAELEPWLAAPVQTNIVMLKVPGDPAAFAESAAAHGVLLRPAGDGRVRLVTNLDVDAIAAKRAAETLVMLLSEKAG